MSMFKKTVIIGTGLIGGSLGLALRRKRLVAQVTGFSRHKRNAILAKKSGAIDCIGSSLDAVKDADLVVLSMPPEAIISTAAKISKKINRECIVIDVGSSKEKIVSRLSRLIPNFVGCHPLAGSEKRGISNLASGIFNNTICIITPVPKTPKKALDKIQRLWRNLGCRVIVLPPRKHDRILAFTSHLPHAVAFSLMGSIPDNYLSLGSGGLRDTTRISASDPYLWSQIFLTNRSNLLFCLSAFQKELAALKLAVTKANKKNLVGILSKANKKREKI